MGDEFDHISLGAMLEDAKLVRLPHEAWGRAAFVTNHDVLGGIATAFGGLVPGEFRVFPLEQQGEAVAWVAEDVRGRSRVLTPARAGRSADAGRPRDLSGRAAAATRPARTARRTRAAPTAR